MTATYGPPRPADQVAALLRRRGIDLDPERLDETAAAQRDRNMRDFHEYRDEIETLAAAAKRTRRAHWAAELVWKQNPTPATLETAKAANAARTAAHEALREACLYDEQMLGDVYRKYGR